MDITSVGECIICLQQIIPPPSEVPVAILDDDPDTEHLCEEILNKQTHFACSPTNNMILHLHDDVTPPCALPCGHLYHYACIAQAVEIKKQCPLCRSPVESGLESLQIIRPIALVAKKPLLSIPASRSVSGSHRGSAAAALQKLHKEIFESGRRWYKKQQNTYRQVQESLENSPSWSELQRIKAVRTTLEEEFMTLKRALELSAVLTGVSLQSAPTASFTPSSRPNFVFNAPVVPSQHHGNHHNNTQQWHVSTLNCRLGDDCNTIDRKLLEQAANISQRLLHRTRQEAKEVEEKVSAALRSHDRAVLAVNRVTSRIKVVKGEIKALREQQRQHKKQEEHRDSKQLNKRRRETSE